MATMSPSDRYNNNNVTLLSKNLVTGLLITRYPHASCTFKCSEGPFNRSPSGIPTTDAYPCHGKHQAVQELGA